MVLHNKSRYINNKKNMNLCILIKMFVVITFVTKGTTVSFDSTVPYLYNFMVLYKYKRSSIKLKQFDFLESYYQPCALPLLMTAEQISNSDNCCPLFTFIIPRWDLARF